MRTLYVTGSTGQGLNPHKPKDHWLGKDWSPNEVAFVLQRRKYGTENGSLRVVTSSSQYVPALKVGDVVDVRNDQSHRLVGTYTVVGLRYFANGVTQGNVPNKALTHGVSK